MVDAVTFSGRICAMLRHATLTLIPAILGVCLFAPTVRSQGFGNIVGTVTDPSGAVLANAKVTAMEAETGVSREALTTSSGTYVIPGLRPTSYSLSVEVPGFIKYSQANIQLTADQSVTVNVAM